MSKREIDIDTWSRKWQYDIFFPRSYPYLSVTSPVYVDCLVKLSKRIHVSFYALMSYIIMKTIQEIDAFKYVFDHGKIYQYDVIHMTFTVLNQECQLRFSPLVKYDNHLVLFLERFLAAKKEAEEKEIINGYLENNLVYITCTPWMRLTSVMNPMDELNKDSIPRVCFGKFFETKEGYFIDLSIQVNHAFQDGYHLGLFYNGVEKNINDLRNTVLFDEASLEFMDSCDIETLSRKIIK